MAKRKSAIKNIAHSLPAVGADPPVFRIGAKLREVGYGEELCPHVAEELLGIFPRTFPEAGDLRRRHLPSSDKIVMLLSSVLDTALTVFLALCHLATMKPQ